MAQHEDADGAFKRFAPITLQSKTKLTSLRDTATLAADEHLSCRYDCHIVRTTK